MPVKFSFEVLPPLKGTGTESLFRTINTLREFAPQRINITTHRSEFVYKEMENGLMQRQRIRRRPGTIAIAAAIQQRYNIDVVPHIVCSGFTKEDVEYMLLDLQFLGISDVLVLRGDKAREEKHFEPTENGHAHALDLISQINAFNAGYFYDGTPISVPGEPFHFGVACYPEKHEEAPNLETDMQVLLQKQENGAEYAMTQLFFDNTKYFDFVKKAQEMGVNIPIIPGIKPISKCAQLTMLPKTFHCDIPLALSSELKRCKNDDEAKQVGIEWTTAQCKELMQAGVPCIHFYTVSAVDSIQQIAHNIF